MDCDTNDSNVWIPPDNTFIKIIFKQGSEVESPRDGSICNITVTMDKLHELDKIQTKIPKFNELVEFTIGEADCKFDKIIENCLLSMKHDEISKVSFNISTQEVQLDDKNNEEPSVHFMLEIKLTNWMNTKEVHEMNVKEKIKCCVHHKSIGVDLFKEGKHHWAFHRFSKALKFLITIHSMELKETDTAEYKLLKHTCYTNMAACQLITGKYDHVVRNCSNALVIDSISTKALFRRGTAYLFLQEFEKAKEDLQKVLALDANNAAARKKLVIVINKIKIAESGYAEAMKKLFI